MSTCPRVHSLLVSPCGVRFVGSTIRGIRQQSDRPHLVIGDELQMPIHDWSKVKPGTYHNFHQLWTSSITNQLNSGILPRGCFAMADHATVSSQRILYQCSVGNKLSANLGRIADRAEKNDSDSQFRGLTASIESHKLDLLDTADKSSRHAPPCRSQASFCQDSRWKAHGMCLLL